MSSRCTFQMRMYNSLNTNKTHKITDGKINNGKRKNEEIQTDSGDSHGQ